MTDSECRGRDSSRTGALLSLGQVLVAVFPGVFARAVRTVEDEVAPVGGPLTGIDYAGVTSSSGSGWQDQVPVVRCSIGCQTGLPGATTRTKSDFSTWTRADFPTEGGCLKSVENPRSDLGRADFSINWSLVPVSICPCSVGPETFETASKWRGPVWGAGCLPCRPRARTHT